MKDNKLVSVKNYHLQENDVIIEFSMKDPSKPELI